MKVAVVAAIVVGLGLYLVLTRLKARLPQATPLWKDGPSIYAFVAGNLDPITGAFKESAGALPDEKKHTTPGGLRWVAGGMDGVFGHHGGGASEQQKAAQVASYVGRIARTGAVDAQRELYALLEDGSLLDYLDAAIGQMAQQRIPVTPHLRSFALNLALHSPDRGAVKFAISLLGLVRNPKDAEVIALLGRHEEFTLFAAVALSNALADPEPSLFELAQRVHGWGRIHCVERLAETKNPAIKQWLLRRGYDNTVMHEYLACICAEAGDLHLALAADRIDSEVLKAATDLLRALVAGGPGRDINDYSRAAEAARDYVRHVADRPLQLAHFIVVQSLHDYLNAESWDASAREKNGWMLEARRAVLAAAKEILSRREWETLAQQGLSSSDPAAFHDADTVARKLSIDTWPVHWARVQTDPRDASRWFPVMERATAERIGAIVELAESRLPLQDIASGPADSIGLGPEFQAHSALDMILQSLGGYSGKGKALVLSGLRSPVVRNRNMAIHALGAWRAADRDEQINLALQRAAAEEPVREVKERIERLLAGKSLD